MEQIAFDQLQEKLYYEKMANGLDVYVLPKNGFNKTFATFTTKYGSIDNHFVPLDKNEPVKVPDGIAHFLEHKMFEKEDGDVFQQFSRQGASANAFTSFTRTAYLFSSTSNVQENLTTLIDFVQDPYFTKETVEKEKGIIGQEITMYDDNPDWRLYYGLIANLYHHHPVKIDIAGTIESISHITKDMLYECYHTFYHPSNMLLFVVGPVDPEAIIAQVRENQASKSYSEQPAIDRIFDQEPQTVAETISTLRMNVQTPKCMVGIKTNDASQQGAEMLKKELSLNVMLDLLFGKSGQHYNDLYREGLIDDTFSYDYSQESGFGFAMIGGDTSDPNKLAEKVKEILLQSTNGANWDEAALQRSIKKKIGGFLRALNSPEYIANQFTRYSFNDMDLFQIVPFLEKLTLDDINEAAKELISEERMSVCQVLPK
ncbi:EF-P 5-aminopentanol modification-associated protein YfmH [Cytobacillus kochii]|uniref:EF-P 5-aminopentanol modification-associated protein YfmH n=1 Tax=Cytobacillus kochii TaxID=859143 RepID=UPI001CD3D6A7|nr:pitrilysin family protein [Cytobacillus kochii]MCA1028535.1 insulinase family protein [Cytobacillus kochii]MCM3321643.1 insulinase family protein [Cytobacillus kochii]MCM3343523.1 insulinase family protein [Cytobacillus kochii]MDM5207354.1 pitrilysin family protein [Cytobacillus kochii]